MRYTLNIIILVFIFNVSPAFAGSVTIPNTFKSGTKAKASEVNANFSAIKVGVNDNDSRIASLEAAIATLQTTVETLQTAVSALETANADLTARLAAVENNSVLGLDGYLALDVDADNRILALFSGVNVQVVNGTGTTDGETNGLGNLIVGYNELRGGGDDRTGSHNIVGGIENNYSSYGGFIVGWHNNISGAYSTISAGYNNTAGGTLCSISGGIDNVASLYVSSVSGGQANRASGFYSSVSGGYNNEASGDHSSVSAGNGNTAIHAYSQVAACNTCTTDSIFDFEAEGVE